jgi:hypothetical protein
MLFIAVIRRPLAAIDMNMKSMTTAESFADGCTKERLVEWCGDTAEGCGLLLVIRRGKQRFVRAPYIWAGKAFCNTCSETREQRDDTGLPWERVPKGTRVPGGEDWI